MLEAPAPLMSFIVPFYGSVSLLKRCLDSLMVQTDGDFEVVVVDDQSPECARELVAGYDSRFRYVLQPENRGPYQGRVRGVEESRGEFVVDVDCDDYILPDLVSELRKAANGDVGDIVIYNVEQDVGGMIRPHWCRYVPGEYTPENVMRALVAKRLQWNFWAKAIRRQLFLESWKLEPKLRSTRVLAPDDYCAVVPLILLSRKIVVIPYVGYRYWQGGGSICRSVSWAKTLHAIRDTDEAMRIVLSFARSLGASPETARTIRKIAAMIRHWWWQEMWTSFKRRFKVRMGKK